MPNIKFGPAGLGGVHDAISNMEEYSKKDLQACEIAFTYGVYIKNKKDAEEIRKKAKELGISLSIHAPYWINLNSVEKEKIEKSKERILNCLEVGTWLGAKTVVFHPGYYSIKGTKVPFIKPSFNLGVKPDGKLEAYEKIKNEILELQKIRDEKNYTPELAPETTGKINVFGSIEEIAQLVRDTKCSFCVDFAHILAREKDYSFEKVFSSFKSSKKWHVHFSGIEYGEKGEKNHKETSEDEWEKLLNSLPKDKEITIINEAPDSVKDSLNGLKIYRRQKIS
ncbi:MAG: TIM barrel protein [Nanoarchaeota archaeon]